MLRAISAFVFLLLFIMLLVFWMENYTAFTTPVEIGYNIIFFKVEPIEMEVWAPLLLMLAMGIAMTFFLEMVGWLKTRSKMVQQNRKIRKLEKELQEYRTSFDRTSPTGNETTEITKKSD